jgi:hypothetical protein
VALEVLIILLSLFASGLLVGNELAIAVFTHPELYSVSHEAHVRVAKPLARRLGHSMPCLVRTQSGIRGSANADHASCARCAVAYLYGRDPLSSYYCAHDSLAGSN